MPLECNLLLQINGSGIEIGNGFKQVDRDGAGLIEDLPGHGTPALALRQGARMDHEVVPMKRQLLRTEQPTAAQQQAHVACA